MEENALAQETATAEPKTPQELAAKQLELSVHERKLRERQVKTTAQYQQESQKARIARQERDAANRQVASLKKTKAELYAKLDSVNAELQQAIRKAGASTLEAGFASRLRKEIEALEWIQQTQASQREEKELAAKIRPLRNQLPLVVEAEKASKTVDSLRKQKHGLLEQLAQVKGQMAKLVALSGDLHAKATEQSAKAQELGKAAAADWQTLQDAGKQYQQVRFELSKVHGQQREHEAAEERKAEADKRHKLSAKMQELRQKAAEIEGKLKAGKKITLLEIQVLAQVDPQDSSGKS
jgi:uncharacterized coiled-coil DUF342 family protein